MPKKNTRKCTNDVNSFCYICGMYTLKSQRRTITDALRNVFKEYFGGTMEQMGKPWVPKTICGTCKTALFMWNNGQVKAMPFAQPVHWMEQRDHTTDCYFCMTKTEGFSRKNRHMIVYPNVASVRKPIPHGKMYPVPKPPRNAEDSEDDEDDFEDDAERDDNKDEDYVP